MSSKLSGTLKKGPGFVERDGEHQGSTEFVHAGVTLLAPLKFTARKMEHPPLPVLHYDSQRGPPLFM